MASCVRRKLELRERILALARRHKRYGVGMTYLKLRQEGMLVNYKRMERLYQAAKLQVRRRKRKKVPVGERQPLLRPMTANQVWSIDFVFDRTAEGRVMMNASTSTGSRTSFVRAPRSKPGAGNTTRSDPSGPWAG